MAGDLLHMNHVNRLEEGGLPGTIVEQKKFTKNGTYWAPNGVAYSPVIVKVPQPEMTETTVTRNGTYTPPPNGAFSKVTVNVPSSGGQIQDVASLPDPSTLAEGDILHLSREAVGTPETWFAFMPSNDSLNPLYVPSLDTVTLDNAFVWNGSSFTPLYIANPNVSSFQYLDGVIHCTIDGITATFNHSAMHDVTGIAGATCIEGVASFTQIVAQFVDGKPVATLSSIFSAYPHHLEPGTLFLTSVEKDSDSEYGLRLTYPDGSVELWYPSDELKTTITLSGIEDVNDGYFTRHGTSVLTMNPPTPSFTFARNEDGTIDLSNHCSGESSDYNDCCTGFIITDIEYNNTHYAFADKHGEGLSGNLIGYLSEGYDGTGDYIDNTSVTFTEKTKVGFGITRYRRGTGVHLYKFIQCPYRIIDNE